MFSTNQKLFLSTPLQKINSKKMEKELLWPLANMRPHYNKLFVITESSINHVNPDYIEPDPDLDNFDFR